jgi:hypothetical protein
MVDGQIICWAWGWQTPSFLPVSKRRSGAENARLLQTQAQRRGFAACRLREVGGG